MLEVVITLTIVVTALLASADGFVVGLTSAQDSQRRARGALFLDTVVEDLSAQDFEALLAFDGDQVFEGETLAASQFAVDLAVFPAGVDLLQIDAALTDRRTGREICRVATLRSRR